MRPTRYLLWRSGSSHAVQCKRCLVAGKGPGERHATRKTDPQIPPQNQLVGAVLRHSAAGPTVERQRSQGTD